LKKLDKNYYIFALRSNATNRRLLNKKIIFDFKKPFDLVLKYKEIWQESRASARRREIKNEECLCWSDLLNEARTYFEENSINS